MTTPAHRLGFDLNPDFDYLDRLTKRVFAPAVCIRRNT
jgi:hypothetical protein